MGARLLAFLGVTGLLTVAVVTGQVERRPDDSNQTREPLRFKAPQTDYDFRDSSFVKSYSGGVYAWQEDVELEADKAVYLGKTAEARFYGKASFKDSLRQLRADTLVYYYTNREALAVGHVDVTEKNRLFRSGRVRYRKDFRLIEAFGGVYVRDDSVRSTITGISAVFNDSTGNGVITGYPVLIREDKGGSFIRITCDDTLEVDRQNRVIRLWQNVVVTKDSLRVVANRAIYDDSLEVVSLYGKPVAQHVFFHRPEDAISEIKASSTVSGDSMWVYLKDRQVSCVEVVGSAHATTVSTDSTGGVYDESIIDSASMRLSMADDRISLITARGTAASYYHKAQREDNQMFVNEAAGDTLYFFFSEGKISQLRITGAGGSGARGKYYEFKPVTASTLKDSTGKSE